jgi:3-oxoacyl-[acyl-carrier protein] reductase
MDLGIAGKRVLVTGGSRGLGRSAALAFAKEGCRVAVVARDQGRLDALLGELGPGHAAMAADLMQAGEAERAVRALLTEGGPFEIVIHNLGGTLAIKDPLAEADQWAEVWRFNVGIAITINNLLIPPMVERGWGRIVHVSSDAALHGRGAAPYAAAKAYLNAYVKGVGRSFAPSGLVISALLPGPFEAEGGHWEKVRREEPARLEEFLRQHLALGRLGTPEELSAFLLFLASAQATFATAAVLSIDGGGM